MPKAKGVLLDIGPGCIDTTSSKKMWKHFHSKIGVVSRSPIQVKEAFDGGYIMVSSKVLSIEKKYNIQAGIIM